jgi:hypothetical protein
MRTQRNRSNIIMPKATVSPIHKVAAAPVGAIDAAALSAHLAKVRNSIIDAMTLAAMTARAAEQVPEGDDVACAVDLIYRQLDAAAESLDAEALRPFGIPDAGTVS